MVAHSAAACCLALCQVLAVGETAPYCCNSQLTFSAVQHNLPIDHTHTQVQHIGHSKVYLVEGN